MPKKTVRRAARSTSSEGQKLTWIDAPPPKASAGRPFNFPGDELKSRKGEWAQIQTCETGKQAGGRAGAIKNSLKKREMEGFEVMSRGEGVFARYTGKKAS